MKEINSFEELNNLLDKSNLTYRYLVIPSLGIELYTPLPSIEELSMFLGKEGIEHILTGSNEQLHIYIPRYQLRFLDNIFNTLFHLKFGDAVKVRNGIIRKECDESFSWAERKNIELNEGHQ